MINKKDLLSLEGKAAIVTGGAAGIGLGTVEVLAAHGAGVAILDVNSAGLEESKRLQGMGYDVKFFRCDVTNEKNVKDAIDEVAAHFGRIDILFNNAGVTVRKTVVDLTEKEWDFVLGVGLKGTFLVSKYVIPVMEKSGGGSIINSGSGWGLKGGDMAAAYCAVKGGIVNLTRAMAIDHGPNKIRVNSVNPGDVDTDMLRDEGIQTGAINENTTQEEYLQSCGADRPLRRIGMPEDIAHAVLFLASELSSWITGAALVVDGGGIA
jgi:NAD(P)-dependent dehydrogenase (short-subunit alcohol dehydrogenase family)